MLIIKPLLQIIILYKTIKSTKKFWFDKLLNILS